MVSIAERFKQLKDQLPPQHKIFIHAGVANPQGGFFVEPKKDPDFQNQLPLIRAFRIAPTKAGQKRIEELRDFGWQEMHGPPKLEDVKTATQKEEELKAKLRAEILSEMKGMEPKASPVKNEEPKRTVRKRKPKTVKE